MKIYLFNFILIGLFIVIRFIEVSLTLIALNLGATEIGIIAKYNIPLAMVLTIPFVLFLVYLNYRWKKRNQDLKEVLVIITSTVIFLSIIMFWDLFQFLTFFV